MSERIVEIARTWIGTPYLHQASVQGVGCDCLGLLRGVWRTYFGTEPEEVPAYTADWSEPQGQELLYQAGLRHMKEVSGTPLCAGQVLLFRMRDGLVAKHIGIVSQSAPQPMFIHSYSGHGVIESPLSGPWRRRIAAQFEISQG
ncbi:NlpC/P60 family protein [Loktanella sp. S4079]|uniref:NlpC/P60 family protein n=1 Tax=Loktanella sp. S4079 TaxID=579483 RepID=UPI0005F9D1A3|nr:NlpC/P60 family protein [Loktanella sp. S4079]KJZ20323.1 peptidase [Loktanella sp. S4079]